MPERFKLKDDVDLRKIKKLPHLLRLMMSIDAQRAASRWLEQLTSQEPSPTNKADLFASTIVAAGWASETIRQIKEGDKGGFFTRQMLQNDHELERLYDDVLASNGPAIVRKIHRVRDKYFAHWDIDIAKSFIEWLASAKEDVAFIESEGGKFLTTRYPWAQAAFAHDLVDNLDDEGEVASTIRELGKYLGLIAKLANRLAAELFGKMRESGELNFERMDSR